MATKKEVKSALRNVLTKFNLVSLHSSNLCDEVKKALSGREMFVDEDTTLDEKIYSGDVFEAIASEQAQYEDGHMFKMSEEALIQLDALAELIWQDYILITNV